MAYITKKTTQDGVKPIGSNLFGLCSSASSSAQKNVSMPDFDVLISGVTIHVYFVYGNTAQNPTLSVGSTSAVAILRNGTNSGKWSNGSVVSFTYNGTNWIQNDADDGSESITYGLSLNGNQLSLVEGGQTQSVTLTDEDTTYSLSINGHTLTLTPSSGSPQSITLPELLYTKDVADTDTNTNNVVQNDVNNNVASGGYALAEGFRTTAQGMYSHAEGLSTVAGGVSCHAEGLSTLAASLQSHAEGSNTKALGADSHSEGQSTIAQGASQLVIGRYNEADTHGASPIEYGKYAFIIGIGNTNSRKNGFTVDWDGNVDIASYAHYAIGGVPIVDHVITQGTSGSWRYRKWASGKVEAWCEYSFASAASTVWASPIRYWDKSISIPSGIFSSTPRIYATSTSTQYWVVGCDASSATAGSLRLATLASSAMATTIRLYAVSD